jgi:arginyl-tRNA synthetase
MKQEIETAIADIARSSFGFDGQIELSRPDEQFGDFATNVALRLAKPAGKNPREVAEAIAAELRNSMTNTISEVTIAGPGFINLRLTDTALALLADQGVNQTFAGQTIIAEYSDPNPFKPLHAGHLYTTLVGDMIARLTAVAGAKTIRINYGGDVGLHVAKGMWGIIRELGGESPEKLEAIPEAERPAWLGARYVEGNNAYEDDETAKAEIISINKRVYQIHETDDHTSPFATIYWTGRQWSYDYFATLYQQLQVTPFDRYIPESEVTPLGITTVKEQLANDVYEQSGQAVIFDGEKAGLHTRVFINSEGLPTYEAKDVGLSLTKWRDYRFDESIIITANEQEQYMKVVIASIAEFAPEPASRTKHLVHGVVKMQGGVKMSSRKGNVVTALEILAAAREAGAETGTNPNEDTILAAVKYAFAKNRIGSDIAYDPKESVALEGNSGPYLQYAHARARSILRKADGSQSSPTSSQEIQDTESSLTLEAGERTLLRKISEYHEAVDKAVDDLMPHHICTYLYELAQTFNRFYENNTVVGDPRQDQRLRLVEQYADRLKDGLTLLGIVAPERM